MGLSINRSKEASMVAMWVADRDVYVVRDGSRLAGPKDLEGRLLCAKAHKMPELEAIRLGLLSAKDASAAARARIEQEQAELDKERERAERAAKGEQVEEDKEAAPAEDKSGEPAEDKAKGKGKGKR